MNASDTILVVDPDATVLRDISLLLEPRGYQVLTARHGVQAIRLFETSKSPVNLIMTAVMMPGLSGFDLVGSLTQWTRGFEVIFMSEHDREILFAENARDGRHFVRKPIGEQAVLQKVREALVERRRPIRAALPATIAALTA